MGKHADTETETETGIERREIHLPALIVVGMLCVTAIITVMVVSGASEVLGQIAGTAFLTWACIMYLRLRKNP